MDANFASVAALGVMIPIVGTIVIGIVLIAFLFFRQREHARLHETLRKLSEVEGPQQSELLAALTKASLPTPDRDLRIALLLFSIAAGFFALAFLIGLQSSDGYEVIWPLVAVATFPLTFGLGRLLLWWMGLTRGQD